MNVYDDYYKTENLFGEPYKELVAFFEKYPLKGELLDVGCGQGRNAIPLAKMGYKVTAIDNAKIGVDQMKENALKEKLNITARVEDIYEFQNFEKYDILLLDSMFHFAEKDLKKESTYLKRIFAEVKPKVIICICIQNTGKKVTTLKNIIEEVFENIKIFEEISLKYTFEDKKSNHKSVSDYSMLVLEKN